MAKQVKYNCINHPMYIIKANGEKELFNRNKLATTLARIGLKEDLVEKVINKVETTLSRRPTSQEVIRRALVELQKNNIAAAARYNLKRAIMNLGPTGFPFEQYIARLLETYGYEVKTNIHAKGFCIHHELDIVAHKENRRIMIECKYHNSPGLRSDVKVTLYTYARFLDIKKSWEQEKNNLNDFHEVWLITNTKCTHDAIQYAKCAGIKIISWRYPENQSLEQLIDNKKLYPVTILLNGNKMIFSKLTQAGYLLTSDLAATTLTDISKKTGLKERLLYPLYQEVLALGK
ncbi:MAG: ATP cone domain-containing protein [Patescibacteria group bacterium]